MSDELKPTFYELEFSSDTTFWTEGDAATRRTFLMPLPNPLQFLAFGVLAPSDQVLFVAQGSVAENLGAFIDRMVRDEARVELYARAPVPEELLRQYGAGLPYETQVLLPPPDPNTPTLTTGDILASLWREGNATTRRTFIMPQPNPAEFLAFGMISPSDAPHFVVRGLVRDDLVALIDRMVREGSSVELYARPPVSEEVLRQAHRAKAPRSNRRSSHGPREARPDSGRSTPKAGRQAGRCQRIRGAP